MRSLHLFAGAGGGLLADLILGHQPVGAVELDPYCCSVLRARRDDGWFPRLRVHERDIRLFDPSEYAGRVDIVAGGFPCQDISAAGKGAGLAGARSGLWSEFASVIGVVRPRYAFIENSPMLTIRGLHIVLSDLAALGYDAEWQVISASQVGAPHRRERIWILAYASSTRTGHISGTACPDSGWDSRWNEPSLRQAYRTHGAERTAATGATQVADTGCGRCGQPGQGEVQQSRGTETECAGPVGTYAVANANRLRQPQPQGRKRDQRGRAGDGGAPDGGSDSLSVRLQDCLEGRAEEGADRGSRTGGDTQGRESQSGLGRVVDGLATELDPDWWGVEPDIGRVATVVRNRVSQLKALGNGQVPLQAAFAWTVLMRRINLDLVEVS